MRQEPNITDGWKQLPHDDQAMLMEVFKRTLQWFYDKSNNFSGITCDRTDERNPPTIASLAFLIPTFACAAILGSKINVNGEEVTMTREIAAARTLKILQVLYSSPQGPEAEGKAGYRGFFYHFQQPQLTASGDGRSVRFKPWAPELSSIDTALAMIGVRFAITFFNGNNEVEREIRRLGNLVFDRVEWKWLLKPDGTIGHGWRPEKEEFIPHAYKGYNEAMILYLLALGAPEQNRVPRSSYDAFLENQEVVYYTGLPLLKVPGMPAFLFQYPQTFIPFGGIHDRLNRESGLDYWQFAGNMARAQYCYAVNKAKGRSGDGVLYWGVTACDGNPEGVGYRERGCPDIPGIEIFDDSTIAPTAAIGFLPFAPDIVIQFMRSLVKDQVIFNHYGFIDAFNLEQHWFDPDSLAIDHGTISLQIANFMMRFVWEVMKSDVALIRGLLLADFRGGWLEKQKLVSRRKLLAAAQ